MKNTNVEKGYSDTRLQREHPQLATAFEQVLEENKDIASRLKYVYFSRFKTKKRPGKSISLGRVVEVVQENGFKVDITPVRSESN